MPVDAVVDGGADLGAEEEAQAEGDIIEATDADGFVVTEFPESGEGGEDEVHETVKVGHVDCEDLNDDLGAEEDERAGDGAFHGIGEGAFGVFVFGVEGRVVSFFAELFGFVMQQFRGTFLGLTFRLKVKGTYLQGLAEEE